MALDSEHFKFKAHKLLLGEQRVKKAKLKSLEVAVQFHCLLPQVFVYKRYFSSQGGGINFHLTADVISIAKLKHFVRLFFKCILLTYI